jgi:hypothetical protein
VQAVKLPGSLVECAVMADVRYGALRTVVSVAPSPQGIMSGTMLCVIARVRPPFVAEDMLLEPDPVIRVLL